MPQRAARAMGLAVRRLAAARGARLTARLFARLRHSSWLPRRAPSTSASSFAHMICGWHAREIRPLREAAVRARDHVLSPDQPRQTNDAFGDELRMLDDVGGVADHAGDQNRVLGQLELLPQPPFVLVPRIGELDGIAAGAHLQHQIGDVLEGGIGKGHMASRSGAATYQNPNIRGHILNCGVAYRHIALYGVSCRGVTYLEPGELEMTKPTMPQPPADDAPDADFAAYGKRLQGWLHKYRGGHLNSKGLEQYRHLVEAMSMPPRKQKQALVAATQRVRNL